MERTNDPVRDAERYFSDLEDMPRAHYTACITMKIWVECEGTNEEDAKEDADIIADSLAANICSMRDIVDSDIDSVKIEED